VMIIIPDAKTTTSITMLLLLLMMMILRLGRLILSRKRLLNLGRIGLTYKLPPHV